jgi:putative transposase
VQLVGELCARWALEPAHVKRLRQLQQENGRLKKMVADRALEIDVLKEITRKKW